MTNEQASTVPVEQAVEQGPEGRGWFQERWQRSGAGTAQIAARVGLIGAFIAIVIAFSIARPEAFPTWNNVQSILSLAAPLTLLAVVLTIPMIMGDFDLSFAAVAQLGGVVALYFISKETVGTGGAIALAILVGVVVGLINGFLVAYTGISAFILTLAVGSVATGLEFAIGEDQNVGLGIPESYLGIARTEILGLNLPVWLVLAIAIILWWVTRQTVLGRSFHAIGGNPEASYLSGLRIKFTRITAFVIVGAGAGFAGILLTARSASYFPNIAQSLLLPAFAAVFIGAAVGARGQFNIFGTVFGVIFMAVIQTGLTMTNQPEWTTNVIFGLLLLAAILLTRVDVLIAKFRRAAPPPSAPPAAVRPADASTGQG
jgi:ribose transport system permease protein